MPHFHVIFGNRALRAKKKIKYNTYKEEVSIITEILKFRMLRLKALVHRNVIKLLRKEEYVVKIREGVFELEISSIIDIIIIIIIIIIITTIIIITVFVFFSFRAASHESQQNLR